MTLRKIFPLFAVLIAAISMPSCKSSRQEAVRHSENTVPGWTRVKVPATIRITSPANMSVNATVTMIRDTSITVSAKFLGMEVFVAQATNDSVLVVDKLHKQYIGQNISEFLANMPFNASTVQDILTGHPVMLPKNMPQGATFSMEVDDDMISRIMFVKPDAATVSLTYPSVITTSYGKMAEQTVIAIEPGNGKKDIKASIEWQWGKARWNTEVEPREVKLSGKYTRINASDITKSLSPSL